MRHRVLALGGRFELNCPVGRGTVLTVAIPAERVLAAGTSAA